VQYVLVEKKKETITESAGRQQKKKIGKIVKVIIKIIKQSCKAIIISKIVNNNDYCYNS